MIIEYDTNGFIFNKIFDPVNQGVIDALNELQRPYIDVPKLWWPPEPVFHPITKEPMLDENGNQIWESKGYDTPEVESDSQYVLNGEIVDRPSLNLPKTILIQANGTDTFKLSNVPAGAKIFSDGKLMGEADGFDIEITSDMPEEYGLQIQKWPYQDALIKVTSL